MKSLVPEAPTPSRADADPWQRIAANPVGYLTARANVKSLDECLSFPKFFEIETVRDCNADCIFCTRPDWQDLGQTVMTVGLFEKIVAELSDKTAWVERVCLSRNGEPLLDPLLAERIARLKGIGIKEVALSTNASLLNAETAGRLIDSGLDLIMVSFDANSPEIFAKTRRKLDFHQVRDNIAHFIALRNRSGRQVKIRIRFIETATNRGEIDAFLDFWQPLLNASDDLYIMGLHSWGNQKYREASDKVQLLAGIPCISPFSTMIVLVNGMVPLCGADYNAALPLGDLRRLSIEAVWRGQAYQGVRHQHLSARRNDIALCRGCDIWNRVYKGRY